MAAGKSSRFNMVQGLALDSKPKAQKTIEEVADEPKHEEKVEPEKNDNMGPTNITRTEASLQGFDLDNIEIKVRTGVGRPKQPGEFQNVTVRLTMDNYKKARIYGGQYGGMTGYINHLIEQDNRKNYLAE